MSSYNVKKELLFLCVIGNTSFTYRGFLVDETETHFIVFDVKDQRNVSLPKCSTVVKDNKQ